MSKFWKGYYWGLVVGVINGFAIGYSVYPLLGK